MAEVSGEHWELLLDVLSRLYRRLRSEPHGRLVECYAVRLVEERLVRHGAWRCLNVVGGLKKQKIFCGAQEHAIVADVFGDGSPILLAHGGGQTRLAWTRTARA